MSFHAMTEFILPLLAVFSLSARAAKPAAPNNSANLDAKGMTPILCTPIPYCPRDVVKAGDAEKNLYVEMSTAVAQNEKVPFINLNHITMSHYAGMTPQAIKEKYFTPADNMHTSPAGAELNAESVVEGLKQLKDCPLAGFLKAQ
jgi:hypothetical protein